MKALIISIGTGARPSEEAVESLVSGITFSINNSNPDKVFFIVSQESEKVTLSWVLQRINKPYEVITLEDPDDINRIYEGLSAKFKEIRKGFEHVTVDFTSGTKAMTGALTILGSLYEADNLSYVAGRRYGGIVVKGTEQVLSVRPYPIIIEKRLSEAISLFNKCQFDSALTIISQIEERIPDPDLLSKLSPFKNAALAYSFWDKFNHNQAFNLLKGVKISHFDKNKAFLGKLLHSEQKEPYYIVDLLNNAKRRGEIEQKYDDAVARLYRTIELITQFRLKEHGIDNTGDVPAEKIPPELGDEFKPNKKGRIKAGLFQAYLLLDAYGDELGKRFKEDERLKNSLQKRNDSILAHGLNPVSKSDYEELLSLTIPYAKLVVKNLDQLLEESTFVKWSE